MSIVPNDREEEAGMTPMQQALRDLAEALDMLDRKKGRR